jgi:hypothetical protein
MTTQIAGNGGTIAEVDGTTFRALRVTIRPVNYASLGFYRVGPISGTMAVSLGANSEVFQWRWSDATNLGIMYKVSASIGANVAATAAALAALRLTIARSWTVAGSGGTRLTMTTNNAKLRASMGTSLVNDIGIPTTGALTAGTKTFDATDIGAVAIGIGTGAITTGLQFSLLSNRDGTLFDASAEGYHPIVFAQNEGIAIRTGANAFPTGMTWNLAVQAAWAEAVAF